MNAVEIMHRCVGLKSVVDRARTVDEAAAAANELQRLFEGQCLRCSHSDDDPIHLPRRARWRTRKPPCSYLPRVPIELRKEAR